MFKSGTGAGGQKCVGSLYTKVLDETKFTIHIRHFQMHAFHFTGPSSFILSANHYKTNFEDKEAA
jgi:hypothetical protein